MRCSFRQRLFGQEMNGGRRANQAEVFQNWDLKAENQSMGGLHRPSCAFYVISAGGILVMGFSNRVDTWQSQAHFNRCTMLRFCSCHVLGDGMFVEL